MSRKVTVVHTQEVAAGIIRVTLRVEDEGLLMGYAEQTIADSTTAIEQFKIETQSKQVFILREAESMTVQEIVVDPETKEETIKEHMVEVLPYEPDEGVTVLGLELGTILQ